MKKYLLLMLLCVTMVFSFSSCSDDEDAFDYPMETLYGTWKGTGIYYEDKWLDLSEWQYQDLAFSIQFKRDGTYYGKGFFGPGKGTYKAVGKKITTYVNGKKYLTYYVTSLSDNEAQIVMYDNDGESMALRVKKVSVYSIDN